MTILDKYNSVKDKLNNGDIILFRGDALISKAIEYFDRAYLSHSGVVLKVDNQLLILDSTYDKKANGVEIDFLINTIKSEKDFMILRPIKDDTLIRNSLNESIQEGIEAYKYNFWFYLRFLLYRYFKCDDSHITSRHAYVCSQFVQYYCDKLGISEYAAKKLITPQDFVRLINTNNIQIIIDKGL